MFIRKIGNRKRSLPISKALERRNRMGAALAPEPLAEEEAAMTPRKSLRVCGKESAA
jgi:hypothetical protein